MPSEPASTQLTREVFGNIPGWSQALFYLLAVLAMAAWIYGIARRVRLWRQGTASKERIDWHVAARRLVRDVLLQRRVWGRGLASAAHVLLFSGFVVLLIATILIGTEHWLADLLGRERGNPLFHKGVYFGIYELVSDTFGAAFLAGCVMFLYRRLRGAGSYARSPADVGILVLLFAIGVTGYFVEGLRLIHARTPLPGLSPVGYLCAVTISTVGITGESARALHFALWWTHSLLALGFIAAMPYCRLLHSLAGTVNLAIRDHTLGTMTPVTLEEVEATGQIGVGRLADFTRRQIIELDACVSCGRCEDSCPAFEVGKPLSPRNVVQDLVGLMDTHGTGEIVHGDTIAAETLWSCTTCGACADVCPLGISPMRMITDMRRYLIGEGALRGSPAAALQKTGRAGNPWGMSPGERLQWAAGLDVPLASEHDDFEVLYWVGCAAAYDRRVQRVARSFVRLLQAANVNFAVLGTEERCTGESARRMGDELLFQEAAAANVETLGRRGVRRIVAHCPHCVNSLRNDYPQVGGNYEVLHHSQLLAELIEQHRLPTAAEKLLEAVSRPLSERETVPFCSEDSAKGGSPRAVLKPFLGSTTITYHDPCYLARASGVVEQPRQVLAAATSISDGAAQIELPRNKCQTSCCGAGGGRMWFDDPPSQRVGNGRVREIAESGAAAVAVSCPFCLIMLGDGLAARKPDVQVRDIAEILCDAVLGPEVFAPNA